MATNVLTRAEVESIARWIGAITTHPDVTVDQLAAVYDFVSTAPVAEIAASAHSLGY